MFGSLADLAGCRGTHSDVARMSRPDSESNLQGIQRACVLKRWTGVTDARDVIELHRLHGNGTFLINADLIEAVEARPDTTITLVNKHKYVVEDSVEQVVERIIEFRARIASSAGATGDHAAGARSLAATEDQEQAA